MVGQLLKLWATTSVALIPQTPPIRGERRTDVILCSVQDGWHMVVEDTAGIRPISFIFFWIRGSWEAVTSKEVIRIISSCSGPE
jgi:hypothetical protein